VARQHPSRDARGNQQLRGVAYWFHGDALDEFVPPLQSAQHAPVQADPTSEDVAGGDGAAIGAAVAAGATGDGRKEGG
jgi:hypothetical protein